MKNLVSQTIHYATLANMAFRKGVEETKFLKYYSTVFDILQKFATTYGMKNRITWYFILLVAEAMFSSPLIIPLTESIFGHGARWMQYTIVMTMYTTLLFIITSIAAEHLHGGNRKHTDLKANLEALQQTTETMPVLHRLSKKDSEGGKLKGVLWSVALVSVMMLIALLRNYLVNGHEWFVFNSPDDVVLFVVPAILALALIYLAQYKTWFFLLRHVKKQYRICQKNVENFKQETLEAGAICIQLANKAHHQARSLLDDKNTMVCINRMTNIDAADPDFFSDLQPRNCTVKVFKNGVPAANVPVRACTTGGEFLLCMTNAQGSCSLEWKSAESEAYLSYLQVNSREIRGDHFSDGQIFSVELDQLSDDAEAAFPTFREKVLPASVQGGIVDVRLKTDQNGTAA